jgi:hypothetical protein
VSFPAAGELLAAFAGAMRERGLRWYVFGALAVVAHGRPRLTADVDVTVELTGLGAADLCALLEARGFALRFPLSPARLAEARLLPLVHSATEIPLDLVIAGPGLDEELLDRALPLDLGGVEVPVVSAEDLLAMKTLAGRRKDLEDVRGVLVERHGKLDLGRTREVLGAFEEATGEGGLLARFERLVRGAAKEVAAGPTPRR